MVAFKTESLKRRPKHISPIAKEVRPRWQGLRMKRLESRWKLSKVGTVSPARPGLCVGMKEPIRVRSDTGGRDPSLVMPTVDVDSSRREKSLRLRLKSKCTRSKAGGDRPILAESQTGDSKPMRPGLREEGEKSKRIRSITSRTGSNLPRLCRSSIGPTCFLSRTGMLEPILQLPRGDDAKPWQAKLCKEIESPGCKRSETGRGKASYAGLRNEAALPICAASNRSIGESRRARPEMDGTKPDLTRLWGEGGDPSLLRSSTEDVSSRRAGLRVSKLDPRFVCSEADGGRPMRLELLEDVAEPG